MVVVMENAMRLPRLPPVSLEIDAGMVDDTVIVDVSQCNDHSDYIKNGRKIQTKPSSIEFGWLRWMWMTDTIDFHQCVNNGIRI